MRTNPHDQRAHAVEQAQRCLMRAAAALTEPATAEVIAFATIEAALGIAFIAKADPQAAGYELAMARLEEARRA